MLIGRTFGMLMFMAACAGQNPATQVGNSDNKIDIKQREDSIATTLETQSFPSAPDGITRSIIGDKEGNIWTSSHGPRGWALSRYDVASLESNVIKATEVKTGEEMFFGIFEDAEGGIWAGTISGVYRYDGKNQTQFKE